MNAHIAVDQVATETHPILTIDCAPAAAGRARTSIALPKELARSRPEPS